MERRSQAGGSPAHENLLGTAQAEVGAQRDLEYYRVRPPSTVRVWRVMKLPGWRNNRTGRAIPWGGQRGWRPPSSGYRSYSPDAMRASAIPAAITPGLITFTRILAGPRHSLARILAEW